MDDTTIQKPAKMGMLVNRPKKRAVFRPAPTFQDNHSGTPLIREKRRRLEKLSLPAESAGRGAFLIAGDCCSSLAYGVAVSRPHHQVEAAFPKAAGGGQAYGCSLHSTVGGFLKGGSGRFGSFDKLELGLAPVGTDGLRHVVRFRQSVLAGRAKRRWLDLQTPEEKMVR